MQRSESIKNIAAALAKFQEEVSNPKTTAENPYYKSTYSPLDVIVNTIKPVLSKHGLSYFQSCGGDGQTVSVTTLLMHTSGEWIESDPLIMKPESAKPQSIGSTITYSRRYSLSSILGIAPEGEDDDANAATHTQPPKQRQQPKRITDGTKKQISILNQQLAEIRNGDPLQLLSYYLQKFNVDSLDKLTDESGHQMITLISRRIQSDKESNSMNQSK